MTEPEFVNLLLIVAVGFAAPFLLGLAPSLRLPAVVLEIVTGIVIGPSVLGWVEIDETVNVVAVIGLAFLLFLAGLEIDFEKLRGQAPPPGRRGLRRLLRALGGSRASGSRRWTWSRRRCSSRSSSARPRSA